MLPLSQKDVCDKRINFVDIRNRFCTNKLNVITGLPHILKNHDLNKHVHVSTLP